MSIEAAIGRIDQILQIQQQLFDPAATATAQTGAASGWEGGGYVEYKLTAGPYAGRYVFAAEGVTPTVSVGQTLSPGQPVATIIPGSSTGIEIGFGSGVGQSAYAASTAAATEKGSSPQRVRPSRI